MLKRGIAFIVALTLSSVLLLPHMTGANANANAIAVNAEDWTEFTSHVFGMSFDYPVGWTVDVPTFTPSERNLGYTITLYPNDEFNAETNKIEIIPQYFEFSGRQSLATLAELSYHTSPFFRDPPAIEVVGIDEIVTAPDKTMEVVHLKTRRPGIQTESLWVSHGKLVYTFITYTQSDEMAAILRKIISTLSFAADAPESLNMLYGSNRNWPSLEYNLAIARDMWEEADSVPECDVACRDAELSRGIQAGMLPAHEPSEQFLEQERIYREHLEKTGMPPSSEGEPGQGAAAPEGQILDTRKALPSNWWAPVQVTGSATKNADCSSAWHGAPKGASDSAMAIDIQQVGTTTPVYAAQTGTVTTVGYDENGYGNYVIINTVANVADQTRTYQHLYAHLSTVNVAVAVPPNPPTPVNRGATQIGVTGNTGNSFGAHLHFHVRYGSNPVDLSPMVGFTPKLGYPTAQSCGTIEDRANSPLIIEPIMFTQRNNNRKGHYWFCYSDQARTTECYMYGVPNDQSGWDNPFVPSQSPELRFTNVYVPAGGTYYIWVCGWGGSYDDDSVHMSYSDAPQSTSDRISFFHPNYWRWSGHTMDIVNGVYQPATFTSVTTGDRVVNVWMREDGMRLDRILLTRSSAFPIANIRCGGY